MKIKKALVFLLLLLLFPINAFADSSITIACSKNEMGLLDSVTCEVKGSSTANVGSISMKVSPINEFDMTFTANEPFSNAGNSTLNENGEIKLMSSKDSTGDNFNIGVLSIRPKEGITPGSKTIKLNDVVFYAGDDSGEEINVDSSYSASIVVKDNSANQNQHGLKELKIEGSTLEFNADNHTPTAKISASTKTFRIIATPVNGSDQIVIRNFSTDEEIPSPYDVTFKSSTSTNDDDVMTIIINVGSCGDECEYILSVTRPKDTNVSDGHVLSSLKVCGKTIDLSTGVMKDEGNYYTYTYDVTLSTDDINNGTMFEAVLIDKSKYAFSQMEITPTADGGSASVNLPANYFYSNASKRIIVDSKDGGKQVIYIINGKINGGNNNNDTPQPSKPVDNPQTGNFSMFIVLIILMGSLITGMVIYKKNIASA